MEEKKTAQKPEMEIVIKRHQQLFELLNDPHRMWRVLLSLFLIIIVLFVGIALVVLEIKKYYPYNVIETNIQGASIMKSEDKEVIYWLFNTADLWANSGIKVEAGDELTIRASGASYTAIHHLVKSAEENKNVNDKWVGTEGRLQEDQRDKLRSKYRINRNCDEGTLMMQVIPEGVIGKDRDWMESKPEFYKGQYVEIIGKERTNLKISKSGVLHFAVNDIVLTDNILDDMYKEWIGSLVHDGIIQANDTSQIMKIFKNDSIETSKLAKFCVADSHKRDSIKSKKIGIDPGYYPGKEDGFPLINELVYYKGEKFRDAWFIDNLGSFLIVIERKKK